MTNVKDALSGIERIKDTEVRLDSHHYIVLTQLNGWVINKASPFARGVLLDYGCGGQPYRKVFSPCISQYIGADVVDAGVGLDIELVPGRPVPLADGSIDTILSTQVLEHVYDFNSYLYDCYRLLVESGRLIITVPMNWRHHEEPFDYWRFSYWGIENSLKNAGFSILDISPCGGLYSILGQTYLDHLAERQRLRPWLTRLINRTALLLDRRIPDFENTLVWMCLAEKNDQKGLITDDH